MQLIFSHVQNDVGATRRLRPVMIELGTTGNPTADSCRVYNYYAGASNPTNCAMPTQGTNNNGNVAGYYYNDTMITGLNHTASYSYDPLNRLVGAAATSNSTCSQTYTYDRYGNMGCAANPAETKCIGLTYGPTTNRITTSGYGYDLAGNLTGDGTYTYQWDAEERLSKVINGLSVAISTNTYNALGQRVRDVTPTATTDEAYGAGGALLWRYTGNSSDPNQRAFVPFGGRMLAEYYSGGTIFDHPDEIGSATTSSDYTGKTFNEKLFYPFGELWTGAAIPNFNMHQTFAQLPDYDSETDQYNTLNRHYNPTGRWLSPDPGGLKVVRLDDPQTWNMYVYARNNPTTVTDPSGLAPQVELSGNRIDSSRLYEGCMDTNPCGDEPALMAQAETPPNPTDQIPPQVRADQTLTAEERRRAAAVAYSETTTGTQAEHEAIISVVVNRANSNDRQYVDHGQTVNVEHVINAPRQFQGVQGPYYNDMMAGRANNQGARNATAAAANISEHGPTNHATAIIVTNGRQPTQREVHNLGNVQPVGRVGNVFLYAPRPPSH